MLLQRIFSQNNEVCSNYLGDIYTRGILVLWSILVSCKVFMRFNVSVLPTPTSSFCFQYVYTNALCSFKTHRLNAFPLRSIKARHTMPIETTIRWPFFHHINTRNTRNGIFWKMTCFRRPYFSDHFKNLWFISVSANFTVDDTRKSINRFAFSSKNASFGTGQYKS